MEEEKIEQGLKSIKQIMDLFLSGLVSTDEKQNGSQILGVVY